MRNAHRLLLIIAILSVGCRSDNGLATEPATGEVDQPDDGSLDTAPFDSPFSDGEVFLSFAYGSAQSGAPLSACNFTGPSETLALVQLWADPTTVLIDRDCQSPPSYRASYYILKANVLRTAHGNAPATVTALYYGQEQRNEDDAIKLATAGKTELWSMRKTGDEWFVVSRWGATPSKDASAASLSEGIDLPAKWSDLEVAIRDAVTLRSECRDGDWGVTETNSLGTHHFTDAEFDTWAHTLDPRFCQHSNDMGSPNTQPGSNSTTTNNTNGG